MFDENYNESIKKINSMELSESNKKELLKIIDNLKYEYERTKNYYELNIEALEEEKKVLLNNFIKKDVDANYLYNIIKEYENSKFYKIFKLFKKDK